jgi:hypothetical protein
MKSKLFGCLSATVLGAAIAFVTPAMAFRGGGGFGGGGGFHGGGGMVTGRSVFVPGGNRFAGAPFAGRHAFVNRRFFDEGRPDRIEDRFEDRSATDVFSSIDSITSRSLASRSLTTTPMVAGAGMARQWINICYDYGGYNYGY